MTYIKLSYMTLSIYVILTRKSVILTRKSVILTRKSVILTRKSVIFSSGNPLLLLALRGV